VETRTNQKSGRLAKHYKCNKCGDLFSSTNITVDHKIPIVGREGFVSWDLFIERLFCNIGNLQVLCKPCHALKTKKETKERKLLSDKNKTNKK
jgi:5-methylcytosine-specific restriction endonuclease McrA